MSESLAKTPQEDSPSEGNSARAGEDHNGVQSLSQPVVIQEDAKSEEASGTGDQPVQAADFAALINTIKSEGIAFRKEEQREDRGKKFREWITVVLVTLTLVAIGWQVHEMIKVYEPIRSQAEAARIQADALIKQVETSTKAMESAQRAWVGAENISLTSAPALGEPIDIWIHYQNSGREPATGFFYAVFPYVTKAKALVNGSLDATMYNYRDTCRTRELWLL